MNAHWPATTAYVSRDVSLRAGAFLAPLWRTSASERRSPHPESWTSAVLVLSVKGEALDVLEKWDSAFGFSP